MVVSDARHVDVPEASRIAFEGGELDPVGSGETPGDGGDGTVGESRSPERAQCDLESDHALKLDHGLADVPRRASWTAWPVSSAR